jgi:hypothetical protein
MASQDQRATHRNHDPDGEDEEQPPDCPVARALADPVQALRPAASVRQEVRPEDRREGRRGRGTCRSRTRACVRVASVASPPLDFLIARVTNDDRQRSAAAGPLEGEEHEPVRVRPRREAARRWIPRVDRGAVQPIVEDRVAESVDDALPNSVERRVPFAREVVIAPLRISVVSRRQHAAHRGSTRDGSVERSVEREVLETVIPSLFRCARHRLVTALVNASPSYGQDVELRGDRLSGSRPIRRAVDLTVP